jgi:hypothetical protein
MNEETRKKVEQRAREILEDPKKAEERWKRRVAERIAYHEILEEERERNPERSGGE